jgi:ribosome-binding factor A
MLHRDRRAAELLQAEIAKIITSELSDPKLGFTTVIGVKLSGDFKIAHVYVSVIGDDKKKKETLDHLNNARGHVRSLLSHRVVMRYMPEIQFEYDTLFDQEQRVSELLNQIHAEEQAQKPGNEE